jgi:hypothetical protein
MLICLPSCATKPGTSPYSPVYITNRSAWALLPPACIEKALDMPQQITGSYGAQEFVLDAWVKADEHEIYMAFFNSLGTNMGELSFREDGISFSSAFFPAALKPEYIAADFQFCFFRADTLAKALKDSGLSFSLEIRDTPEAREEVRTVHRGRERIIEIVKTGESVRYTNFLRGYRYVLRGAF